MAKPVRPLPSRIVLASASPRREELLRQIGITPIVRPANIDENLIRHDDPTRLAVDLAIAKARAIGAHHQEDLPILAADTVVVVAGEILEKPIDVDDARRMLALLSGRVHRVITGVAVIANPGAPGTVSRFAESRVVFAELSEGEVDEYLASGEWRDVAGGYRIQGFAARYITTLSGSYSNVVGLPLHLVYSILTE
ncbi:MAG: Maf family protein [Spirochaetota bacterium]